ncbi:hypothetical protein C8R43DRAFT_951435 [Mycena crocata]|nr:hypothetical protein C8R43DRAFT_951435 [Mycena crocata]
MAMHTILASGPNITDISLSLSIWSSDSTEAPDRFEQNSLPLYSQVGQSGIVLHHLFKTVLTAVQEIFGFPYPSIVQYLFALGGTGPEPDASPHRIENYPHRTPFPAVWDAEFLLPIVIPALRVIHFQTPYVEAYHQGIIEEINSDSQLNALIRYNMPEESAFDRVALPALYTDLQIHDYKSDPIVEQLRAHPDLGSSIRSLDMHDRGESANRSIISTANHLEKLVAKSLSAELFHLLGTTAGSTLKELSTTFQHFPIPASVPKNLIDVHFQGDLDLACLTCKTPQEALAKITARGIFGDPDAADPALFPSLREIRCQGLGWPTTEWEISKSKWVLMAETFLEKNI